MEKLEGFVERITFRNTENGYTVLSLNTGEDEYVLTGIFSSIGEGEYIQAEGEFKVHPVYGEQINVTSYAFVAPSDRDAVLRYLGSGAIKGIGPKLAKRIVDTFGDDTFRIVEEETERLSEVKGISERAAMDIAEQVIEKREVRGAMLYLQQFGISVNLAAKIYKQYGMELYRVIRENPYRLAEDIDGVGFRTADEIAKQAGIQPDSEFRIRAALLYVLSRSAENGHTYLPKEVLFKDTEDLLGADIHDSDRIFTELQFEKKIVVKKDGEGLRVYASRFYRIESDIAVMLAEMNICDTSESDEKIAAKIRKLEKESGLELDDAQKKAVHVAVQNGVSILTGGPGTGKTTTINMIIRYFLREGLDIFLAAPTGRAAKRMTEATGYEAQTIHRLLEVSGDPTEGRRAHFERNADMPLECDAVIIDETSMVDVTLMHALLKAMVPGMRLVLVGDADQLPSVGPGEVLKDLIASDVFPVVQLKKIFRQAEESDIVMNAHKINGGEHIVPKKSNDFLFILRDNAGQITGATITLLKEKLPKYVHAETKDIQVLTPMRKGPLGVENLNTVLQEAINPKDPMKMEHEFSFGIFREGDKVMQVKNDYQLEWRVKDSFPEESGTGVYNGDTGIIRFISPYEETLTVEFEDRKCVTYPFTDADELELAYAVTIHKSQGSEYPAVILPLLSGPRMLMTRNLLYTGVTRAKKCVCIVGDLNRFTSMIDNTTELRRYSGLKDMIRELYRELS